MDEMKIKLSSKLVRGLVTKIIAGIILKQTGYHINIDLNEVVLTFVEGEAHLHADVDATMNKEDFKEAVKKIGLS